MRNFELYQEARPMFSLILSDGTQRMPMILRLARPSNDIDDELIEQVDNYFAQMGRLMRVYSRLSRTVSRENEFYDDLRPLLTIVAGHRSVEESRCFPVYKAVMQDFLFDLALAPEFGDTRSLEETGISPEKALEQGLKRLRSGVGEKSVNWEGFKRQVVVQ